MGSPDDALVVSLGRAQKLIDAGANAPSLLRMLQGADVDLKARLNVVAQANGVQSTFGGAQAQAYGAQIAVVTEYVKSRMAGLTHQHAVAAYQQSAANAGVLLNQLNVGFTGIAIPLRLRQAGQMGGAVTAGFQPLLAQHATSVDRYGAAMIGEFRQIMMRGMAAGATNGQLVDALVGHGGPKGPAVSLRARVDPATGRVVRLKEEDIPEGLFVRKRHWAKRLIRTETAHAQNEGALQAMHEQAKEFPDMGKKILAVLDNRTAPDSMFVHGQVRGLNDLFMDGAGRQYLRPPARPNDRETIVPWRLSWADTPYTEPVPPEQIAQAQLARQPAGQARRLMVEQLTEQAEAQHEAGASEKWGKVHSLLQTKRSEIAAQEGAEAMSTAARQAAQAARKLAAKEKLEKKLAEVRAKAQAQEQENVMIAFRAEAVRAADAERAERAAAAAERAAAADRRKALRDEHDERDRERVRRARSSMDKRHNRELVERQRIAAARLVQDAGVRRSARAADERRAYMGQNAPHVERALREFERMPKDAEGAVVALRYMKTIARFHPQRFAMLYEKEVLGLAQVPRDWRPDAKAMKALAKKLGFPAAGTKKSRVEAAARAQPGPAFIATGDHSWAAGKLTITARKSTGQGMMGSEFVTVRDEQGVERKCVWKRQSDEASAGRKGIKVGTYHEREAATFAVDSLMGEGGIVPPTFSVVIDGKRGSLQMFAAGSQSTQDTMFYLRDNAAGIDPDTDAWRADPARKRMLLLDIISGNDDRHQGNAMWKSVPGSPARYSPIAIDNGLTFPTEEHGPCRFLVTHDTMSETLYEDISSELLGRFTQKQLADTLRQFPGITPSSVRGALARTLALRKNATALRPMASQVHRVRDWMSKTPKERGFTSEEIRELNLLSGLPEYEP